jgi:hypothetical protein
VKCCNCIHSVVCGSSSPYNDASQCKQFVHKDSVIAVENLDDLLKQRNRYEMLYHEALRDYDALEAELKPLRLIKQTLEMASGAKFHF